MNRLTHELLMIPLGIIVLAREAFYAIAIPVSKWFGFKYDN